MEVFMMNLRLQQLLNAENLSQAEFADRIGVARASVSHIIAGRNKPSYEVIQKISENFPTISLDWLINGNGKMYRSEDGKLPLNQDKTESEPTSDSPLGLFDSKQTDSPAASRPIKTDTLANTHQKPKQQKIISRVVVFFTDGTFQELHTK